MSLSEFKQCGDIGKEEMYEQALKKIKELERHMAECPEGKERIKLQAKVSELEALLEETLDERRKYFNQFCHGKTEIEKLKSKYDAAITREAEVRGKLNDALKKLEFRRLVEFTRKSSESGADIVVGEKSEEKTDGQAKAQEETTTGEGTVRKV